MSSLAQKYDYRRRLPHFTSDRPMFVTFRKLSKDPFPPQLRTIVFEHCLYENGKKIDLDALVIMPEHVHLLFTGDTILKDGLLVCRRS